MPTAIVTGSSRGIGNAIARRFARDGYDVVINYLQSEDRAEATAAEIRESTDVDSLVVQADVSDPAAVELLVEQTVDRFGGVDHVVNNAGVEEAAPTSDLSVAAFETTSELWTTRERALRKGVIVHAGPNYSAVGSAVFQ